jgi:hypothetical protein
MTLEKNELDKLKLFRQFCQMSRFCKYVPRVFSLWDLCDIYDLPRDQTVINNKFLQSKEDDFKTDFMGWFCSLDNQQAERFLKLIKDCNWDFSLI